MHTNDDVNSSSHTIGKPNMLVAQLRYSQLVNDTNSRMVFVDCFICKGKKAIKISLAQNASNRVRLFSNGSCASATNVICSQSRTLDLSNIPLVDNPYFSNEYLKKRRESYEAVVKILVQYNPLL